MLLDDILVFLGGCNLYLLPGDIQLRTTLVQTQTLQPFIVGQTHLLPPCHHFGTLYRYFHWSYPLLSISCDWLLSSGSVISITDQRNPSWANFQRGKTLPPKERESRKSCANHVPLSIVNGGTGFIHCIGKRSVVNAFLPTSQVSQSSCSEVPQMFLPPQSRGTARLLGGYATHVRLVRPSLRSALIRNLSAGISGTPLSSSPLSLHPPYRKLSMSPSSFRRLPERYPSHIPSRYTLLGCASQSCSPIISVVP